MKKGSFKITVILILISLIIPFFGINTKKVKADTTPWFDSNYLFRIKVTIKFSQRLFWAGKNPVKIDLNSSNVPFFWNHVSCYARDIYVTDKNGHFLPHWIENWDYYNKKATIWINFNYSGFGGVLSDTQVAYIYYGHPTVEGHGWHSIAKPYEAFEKPYEGWYAGYGEETFDFFDDFEGDCDPYDPCPPDSNKWWFPGEWRGPYSSAEVIEAKLYVKSETKSLYSPNYSNFVWEARFATERKTTTPWPTKHKVSLLVIGEFDVNGDGKYDDDDKYGCCSNLISPIKYYWGDYTNKEVEQNKWYKSVEICDRTNDRFIWEVYKDVGGTLDFKGNANIVGPVDGKIDFYIWDCHLCTGYLYIDYVFVHKYLSSFISSISLLEEKQIDLGVNVASNTDSVYSGEDIEFTVTASNNDSNYSTTNVNVVCHLPSNCEVYENSINVSSGSASYDASSKTITWNMSSMAPNSTKTLNVKVKATSKGNATFTANIDSNDYDTNPSNNASSKTVIVNPSADISVSKSGINALTAGNQITYTITVTNLGYDAAENVTLTDTIPTEILNPKYSTDNGSTWTSITGTPPELNLNLGSLSSGSSKTILVRGTVDPSLTGEDIIINTAKVTTTSHDSNENNNESTKRTFVGVFCDVKSGIKENEMPPESLRAGDYITYRIIVFNYGPSDAPEVSLRLILRALGQPTYLQDPTFIYSTDGENWIDGGEWTGSFMFPGSLKAIEDPGDLDSGPCFYINITGRIDPSLPDGSTLFCTFLASSPAENPDYQWNNGGVVATNIYTEADLSVEKIDDTDPVIAGETLTYTITITNSGPSYARNVILTDDIPDEIENPEFRYRISSNGGTTWGDWSDWSSWSSPYNLGTLPDGEKFEVEIRGRVDPSTPEGTTIHNEASVSSDAEDPYIDNNTDTENTDVITRADLSITKTLSKDTNLIETEIEYTIVVKNNGPSYARNVKVDDKLPEGLEFVSYSCDRGTYDSQTGVWSIGDMADGEEETLKITAKVRDYNPITNTAEVITDTTDPDQTNNKAVSNKVIDVEDPLIKGTDTREGYFEFFVNRENKTWLLRIPDKGYTTGWMSFDSFNDSTCMSGTYKDDRYALFFTKCSEDKFNIAFFDKEKDVYIIYSPDLITIKGTATREGYFEFHVDRSLKQWIIIIPDKLYITGWMPFNRLRDTGSFMSGYYADKRYHLLFDWHSSGRCHLIFNDRRVGISVKFAGR